MLPTEAITEYMDVYKKTFGRELSWEMAKRQSENLFQLFEAIFKPITNYKSGDGKRGEIKMPKLKYKEYTTPDKGKQLCILVDVKEVDNKFYNPQQDSEDKVKRLDWLFAYDKRSEMRVHIWTSPTMTVFNGKKSNALKVVEALMNKELSSKELKSGIADTSVLLGKKVYLQVKHEKDEEGGIKAKVTDYQGLSGDSF